MRLHCPASEVTGLKGRNWNSRLHVGAAAMDVPLQRQAARCFSRSSSWYDATEACCVGEGFTSSYHRRAACCLRCSHCGYQSISAHVLKPMSPLAPGVRERRALVACKQHSHSPQIAEVTKKSSGERKSLPCILPCSTVTEAHLAKLSLWKWFQKLQSWWWDETCESLYEWLICGSAADYKETFTLSCLFFWLLLHHILFQMMHCK